MSTAPKTHADQLRDELHSCLTDYEYLVTIVPDKNSLHTWLRMRAATVTHVLDKTNGEKEASHAR